MNQICIITPIISDGFRDNEPLHASLPAKCDIRQVFLDKGPASVESAVDEVLAGPGVIDAALQAEKDGSAALVIDCMLDPALDAARESIEIPVVGCGESSLHAAAAYGRFSVVTVLQRQEHAFFQLAARYGLAEQLVSVRGIGVSVLDLERDHCGSVEATIREARAAANEDRVNAIVFGCTGMLGFAGPVAEALGWPVDRVIDPLPNAVRVAHHAAMSGEKTDKTLYPAPDAKKITGYEAWASLNTRMAGCGD